MVKLVRDCVPLVALVPVHAPDAVQLVALVELHVSVALPPLVTEVTFAERVTVGAEGTAGVTVIVVLWLVEPVVLVQVKV